MAMGVYARGVEEKLEVLPVGQDVPERTGMVRHVANLTMYPLDGTLASTDPSPDHRRNHRYRIMTRLPVVSGKEFVKALGKIGY